MNVVDSSGWLEHFAEGPNAAFFERAISNPKQLIVPSISIAEVFRRTLHQRGRRAAFRAVAQMRRGRIVDLDRKLAVAAAQLGLRHKLALADSVILATARAARATLWTQDADFDGVE